MLRFLLYCLLLVIALGLAAVAGVAWYIVPQLPPVESLREVHLQTPLKVYTSDNRLIAEFGEKRRTPVAIGDVPLLLKQAFLAAEDDRFYEHAGVDGLAIARSVLSLVRTREKKQGGSTITMQVARNFFLTPEKKFERKLMEVALAFVIERSLSKDEIFELYLNKIFLGHRAYGVAAAAQVYYGVPLAKLDLAQMATIASLPKAPSKTNPISDPTGARDRRTWVLGRMLTLGYIDERQYAAANAAPSGAQWHGQAVEVVAPHVAEMVRDFMIARYGDAAYTSGFKVTTTLNGDLQTAAVKAIQSGLADYDHRHGFRGAEARVDLPAAADTAAFDTILNDYRESTGLEPALVVTVEERKAIVYLPGKGLVTIPWEGLSWARKYLGVDAVGAAPTRAEDVVHRGDIVRVRLVEPPPAQANGTAKSDKSGKSDKSIAQVADATRYWRLDEVPAVEGALISLDPDDGKVLALVGGNDYDRSAFNRVTQAKRQPGSNFKPFIYSAALDKGYTAASFINDAPIVFDAPGLESAWRPENFSGNYFGPMRLRDALTKSRNLVSIRLLRAVGIDYALNYVTRFGFRREELPANLSLALGSGELTPWALVSGYTVFANGGYKVEPYFVARIADPEGQEVYRADPLVVCRECEASPLEADGEPVDVAALNELRDKAPGRIAPRVADAANIWIMDSILQDVIKFGTGVQARALGRKDLAGKTGTTNDQKDAWFTGFNSRMVTTVWVGFDRVAPLGKRETGAQAALPLWMDYMRDALAGVPESVLETPPGVVTVRIDPDTGLLAGANDPNAIFESFRADEVPGRSEAGGNARVEAGGGEVQRASPDGAAMPEQIF